MSETSSLLQSDPLFIRETSTTPLHIPGSTKKESVFWRGFKVITAFIYETPLFVIAIVVAGVVCHFFIPPLAIPLYTLAATTVVSKLVVKVLGKLKWGIIERVEQKAWKLNEKFPKLRLISFIFVLAISFLTPLVGATFAIALGIYQGVISEVEQCKVLQETQDREHKQASLGTVNLILVQ